MADPQALYLSGPPQSVFEGGGQDHGRGMKFPEFLNAFHTAVKRVQGVLFSGGQRSHGFLLFHAFLLSLQPRGIVLTDRLLKFFFFLAQAGGVR